MESVENQSPNPPKETIDLKQFIEKNPEYRIYYTRFLGGIVTLPQTLFTADSLTCRPRYDEDEAVIYFERNDGWKVYPTYDGYEVFLTQLNTDAERLKNHEPQEFTEPCRFNARRIVLHLNHNDRQYKAHWYQGEDVWYLYQTNCPHRFCAGIVKVKIEPNWTNDLFLAIAKIAIHAYLDGTASTSF